MKPRDLACALFGDYRAEWPSTHFADYFVHPAYFAKLESQRPCFLFGGRGTGKTTALRSLRFDAAHTRAMREDATAPPLDSLQYFGVYIRMDKNQVRAFEGPDLPQQTWTKVFAHYFNLLAGREFCLLFQWVEKLRPDLSVVPSDVLAKIGRSLTITAAAPTARELQLAIEDQIVAVELFVNNPTQVQQPLLSMAERPVREFADAVAALAWAADKPVFCCIDEYENLLADHQSVLNTYVKHSSPPLSYKIGVRSNGLRSRATIDTSDQLQTPDDYIEIDIPQEGFEMFARQVAEVRLEHAQRSGVNVPGKLDEFLESLTPDKEAGLLGVGRVAASVLGDLKQENALFEFASKQPPLRLALVAFWHEARKDQSTTELVRDWIQKQEQWDVRYGNYVFNLLVWLSKGRKGARVKKYYAGSQAFLSMAAGNIRYFMELMDGAIAEEIGDGPLPPVLKLSPKSQTAAAKAVGQKRLEQLEGVSENGVRLKRLVLGLGRVFFERSRTVATAPEQTMFTVSGDVDAVNRVVALLADGVAHLAFESSPRTKRTSGSEPKDLEYRIHPVYSAFFEISYRRKRRISFDAAALETIIVNPSAGIAGLLGAPPDDDDELPEQMALFAPFYRTSASS